MELLRIPPRLTCSFHKHTMHTHLYVHHHTYFLINEQVCLYTHIHTLIQTWPYKNEINYHKFDFQQQQQQMFDFHKRFISGLHPLGGQGHHQKFNLWLWTLVLIAILWTTRVPSYTFAGLLYLQSLMYLKLLPFSFCLLCLDMAMKFWVTCFVEEIEYHLQVMLR